MVRVAWDPNFDSSTQIIPQLTDGLQGATSSCQKVEPNLSPLSAPAQDSVRIPRKPIAWSSEATQDRSLVLQLIGLGQG
jgi:hypothetical protein